MEEGDQPKSRERILWKSAKLGGKEGRLNSRFKGLNCRKYQEDFKGKQGRNEGQVHVNLFKGC